MDAQELKQLKELQDAYLSVYEAKKVDQDGDNDTDFADVMIARMIASGVSKEEAIRRVKDKEYNEEFEIDEAETGRGPRLIDPYDKPPYSDDVKDAPKYKPFRKGPKRKGIIRKEETDLILSHLLDEGYADTQESAEVIMTNMSEEWRQSIVEANAGPSTPVKIDPKMGVVPNLGAGRVKNVRPKGTAALPDA